MPVSITIPRPPYLDSGDKFLSLRVTQHIAHESPVTDYEHENRYGMPMSFLSPIKSIPALSKSVKRGERLTRAKEYLLLGS